MHATGWSVISNCTKCGLMMNVRLDDLTALRGPRLGPWNRKARCKKIGCEGWVEFQVVDAFQLRMVGQDTVGDYLTKGSSLAMLREL